MSTPRSTVQHPHMFEIDRTIHKVGNAPEENEDAVLHVPGLVAIADGATEAAYSKLWARLLIDEIIDKADGLWQVPQKTWERSIAQARLRWDALVPRTNIPWNFVIKRQEGSAATIAALVLNETSHRFRLFAVGDATIVHLPQQGSVMTWPMAESSAFSHRPSLLTSNLTHPTLIQQYDGAFADGDHFLLMTDALAAWCLRQQEQGTLVWQKLLGVLNTDEQWAAFVRDARQRGMKNDDTTLVKIFMGKASEALIEEQEHLRITNRTFGWDRELKA